MKRAGWFLTTALTIAMVGCGGSTVADNTSASTPPAAPAAKPQPADRPSGSTPDIMTVLSVEHEVDVLAQRDGTVMETLKDEGQRVKAGEELGQLDDRAISAQLEKARADLEVAENNVKYNEAELKAKQANFRRQQQMRALGLSSEADLENAEFLAKGAEYDLKSWHAVVASNHAQIHGLEIELDKTRIRAPFAGVVARRYIRQGQGVAKDEKCFRISQLGPLQVQFQVPEMSGRTPQLGDSVELSLAGDAQRVLNAHIVKLSPIVDPSSDSYDITARVTGENIADLRPGMAVRIAWPGPAAPRP